MKDFVVICTRSSSVQGKNPDFLASRAVAEALKCPLIHDIYTAEAYMDKYDTVIVKPNLIFYSKHVRKCWKIIEKARRVFYLSFDYMDFEDPSGKCLIDKRFIKANSNFTYITTVPEFAQRYHGKYVNLNRCVWKPKYYIKHKDIPIMYGRYRPERKESNLRFLHQGEWIYSTTPQFLDKIASELNNSSISFVPGLKMPNQLGMFKYSLYIEDDRSHEIDCSIAMRAYEMASADVVFGIDRKAKDTFLDAGYSAKCLEPFLVGDYHEFKEKILGHYDELVKLKTGFWYKFRSEDHYKKLLKDIRRAVCD